MAINIEEAMQSLDPREKMNLELEAAIALGGSPNLYRGSKTIDYKNPKERAELIRVYREYLADSARPYIPNPQDIAFV